jgi:hypothetical protein
MLTNLSYPTKAQINAIAARALIDEEFKAGILNGTRSKKLQEYPLPETFHRAVLAIKADDLNQFIFKLYEIIGS